MNDEQFSLASAYLDGELTDDERASAEADPTVMDEVESLRALRDELRTVEPPSARSRESAIAAALAVFGSSAAASVRDRTTSSGDVAPVVAITRRPWFARALTAAAAVVVVGLGAVVITQVPGGDDDAAVDEGAAQAVAEDVAEDVAAEEREVADEAADEVDEAAAEMAAAPEVPVGSSTTGAAVEEMVESEMVAEVADGGADEATGETGGVGDLVVAEDGIEAETCPPVRSPERSVAVTGPGTTPEDPITDVEELCEFARSLLASRDAGELASTPETSCPTEFIWGSAHYRPDFDEPDSDQPDSDQPGSDQPESAIEVYIAVDHTDRYVTVVDSDDCAELLVADLAP